MSSFKCPRLNTEAELIQDDNTSEIQMEQLGSNQSSSKNAFEGGDSAIDLLKDVGEEVAEQQIDHNATQGTTAGGAGGQG